MTTAFGVMRLILVAVISSCFGLPGTYAEDYKIDFVDGNKLYEFCQESPDYCTGYVAGVAAASERQGDAFCIASNVKSDQLGDFVRLWLRDHRESRHKAGSLLVVEALKEKFPCN
ncbi:MAG: Rap1a/Tai family immunity protein [Methyloceanibacter sp.]